MTEREWLETWLWEYKRQEVRAITFDSYVTMIRKHLIPHLGHLGLRDVRPEHIQHCYNALRREEDLSARTVRYCHTLLRGACAQAEKNGLIVRNVVPLVTLPRMMHKVMRTFTLEQVAGTLFPTIARDRLCAAIVLAFGAGLRRGELLGLRWQDTNLAAGVVHIRQTVVRVRMHELHGVTRTQLLIQERKTAASRRTIPLPALCVQALRHHKAHQAQERLLCGTAYTDNDLVFCCADGSPLDPRNFNRYFTRALRQAELPHIRLHDSRHSYSTLLLEQGVSPKTMQAMLGHASIRTTLDTYSHVSLELEQQAAAKLDAALQAGPLTRPR